MPPSKQSKINTIIAVIGFLLTIGGILWGTHKYLVPIETLPHDLQRVENVLTNQSTELDRLAETQVIQTEAIKTLAEVAKDSKDMRRDVDRHTHQIERLEEQIEKLEQ